MTPRVLSAESEGRLAYLGAVAAADHLPALIAVCDVGGGSTEVAFGGAGSEPDWVDSIDIGSLRLSSRFFPEGYGSSSDVRAARAEVRRHLVEIGWARGPTSGRRGRTGVWTLVQGDSRAREIRSGVTRRLRDAAARRASDTEHAQEEVPAP